MSKNKQLTIQEKWKIDSKEGIEIEGDKKRDVQKKEGDKANK